jgi:modulator of FtsH protease
MPSYNPTCQGGTHIADWGNFLAAQAEAAATLTGLVFVAISINAEKVLTLPGLPGRAAEAVLQFLQAFFVASIMLAPAVHPYAQAGALLLVGLVSYGAQMLGLFRYLKVRTGHPWSWFVWRCLFTQLGTLPFLVAAALLLAGNVNAPAWLVPGFLFSFAGGLVSSWVLLIEIRR